MPSDGAERLRRILGSDGSDKLYQSLRKYLDGLKSTGLLDRARGKFREFDQRNWELDGLFQRNFDRARGALSNWELDGLFQRKVISILREEQPASLLRRLPDKDRIRALAKCLTFQNGVVCADETDACVKRIMDWNTWNDHSSDR